MHKETAVFVGLDSSNTLIYFRIKVLYVVNAFYYYRIEAKKLLKMLLNKKKNNFQFQ